MTIGFVGQGWIGKNYADSFEDRGFPVVRYAKEEPFVGNKDRIADCDVVFIAVPTPTTPDGSNFDAVRSALSCVGKGKAAVIKSTILPKTTRTLQGEFPEIVVLFSPEFLREVSARKDVDAPDRNIIGITREDHRPVAETVLGLLPAAPYATICTAEEAEFAKYAGNTFLYLKVVYMNMLHDLAQSFGGDWAVIAENLSADPRIGTSHMHPVHPSGHTTVVGRGAGGHCFIKDFAAFSRFYRAHVKDAKGIEVLRALEQKNEELLRASGKDIDLLEAVYGSRES